MSPTKRKTALLVLALVALVILFVVGLARRTDSSSHALPTKQERARWLGRLNAMMSAPGLAELEPRGCRIVTRTSDTTTLLVAENERCEIAVHEGGWLPRGIVVRTSAKISLAYDSAGEPDVPTRVRLPLDEDPKDEARLALSTDAGELRIECQQAGQPAEHSCRVEIRNPDS